MIRSLSRLTGRLPSRADDTGSMPMALLIMIVGLALGSLMIPVVINQAKSTVYDKSTVHQVDAAQAGVEAALGMIRSATTGSVGTTAKLPCATSSAPITGSLGGGLSYSVTLAYYLQNPVGQTPTWLSSYPTGNQMLCGTGYGTYMPGTPGTPPGPIVGSTISPPTQAMEGSLQVSPGTVLKTGYDFTMPGGHPATVASFPPSQTAFTVTCVSGGGGGTVIVNIPGESYTDPLNDGADWFPSGDQHDPSVYQGSVVMPDLCSGGLMNLSSGGTFTSCVAVNNSANSSLHVRWHYSANGSAGGWSGTSSYNPPNGNCVATPGTPGTAAQYVPNYVLITSVGSDGTSTRTVQSTYTVQTTNTSITGGTVAIYPTASGMCMAVGWSGATTVPTAGTAVQMEPCETDPNLLDTAPPSQSTPGPWPWQVWAYNADLSIELVSSVSYAYPNGLCLDAATPHTNGVAMTVQACETLTHTSPTSGVAYDQQWSIDGNSHLQGALSNESNVDGYCVSAASQSAGTPLTLKTCTTSSTDTTQTWVPSPNAGAGSAGPANNQLVNFQQFARCMDVTNQSVTGTVSPGPPGGNNFLEVDTCKQNPNQSLVSWSQKYTVNSYSEIVTTNGSTSYCVSSPLAAYTGNGPYVTVVACPTGAPPAGSPLVWTSYGLIDSSGNTLPYSQKFTFLDSAGLCLSLTQGSADLYNGYSKVIVATCDGGIEQKWNATANLQTPTLQNTLELP